MFEDAKKKINDKFDEMNKSYNEKLEEINKEYNEKVAKLHADYNKNVTVPNEKRKKVFATDENGKYVDLIIPAEGDEPELNLTGKHLLELTVEEALRAQKYAASFYKTEE